MLVLIAYLLLPLIVTIVYSLFDKWTEIVPHGFSVKSYVELFQDPEFLLCILRSLIVCVVPIVLTTVIILLAMFVTNLYFPKLDKYVQIICMIPYTIQGVILSVSILAAYVRSDTFLSNRMVMLFGAYSVIIMPYIYQGIKNGLLTVNVYTLVEAAEMLGCSRIYAFLSSRSESDFIGDCFFTSGSGNYLWRLCAGAKSYRNIFPEYADLPLPDHEIGQHESKRGVCSDYGNHISHCSRYLISEKPQQKRR